VLVKKAGRIEARVKKQRAKCSAGKPTFRKIFDSLIYFGKTELFQGTFFYSRELISPFCFSLHSLSIIE